MFVAELDRPWSETPFRFQGFEILSRSEIDLLQAHCKTVFIDPNFVSTITLTRDVPALFANVGSSEKLESDRLLLRQMFTREPVHPYPKLDASRIDTIAAEADFRKATKQRDKLLKALRKGSSVRAAHCRGVVEPLLHRMANEPDAIIRAAMFSKRSNQSTDRSVSTAIWCAAFARYLELPPSLMADLAVGGLMLDIGMTKLAPTLRVDESIYTKRQMLAMRSHVMLGADMLKSIPDLPDVVRQMVIQHQERSDGMGYPSRIHDDQRTPAGTMAATIDQFDGIITGSARRPARAVSDALGELIAVADGSTRDSMMIEQFIQSIGRFPSGSIVELNSGEVGVVLIGDPTRRLRPTLHIVTAADKSPAPIRELALRSQRSDPANPKAIWIVRGHPPGAFGINPEDVLN